MRFAASAELIKTFAHRLGIISPGLSLSTRLEVLSKAMGYADWHEASSTQPISGIPLPLPGNGSEFIGVGMGLSEKSHDAIALQLSQAMFDRFGYTAALGADDLCHLSEAARILMDIGITQAGPMMPADNRYKASPKSASVFYKRLGHDVMHDSENCYFTETSEIFSCEFRDIHEMPMEFFYREPYDLSEVYSVPLTSNSIKRFRQEIAHSLRPLKEDWNGMRCENRSLLAVVRVHPEESIENGTALKRDAPPVGACVFDIQLECPQEDPTAHLKINVRGCLAQTESMIYTIWSSVARRIQDLLSVLLAARIGQEQYQIRVDVTGEPQSDMRLSNRERAAIRTVLNAIVALNTDHFGSLVAESEYFCGIWFRPLAKNWQRRSTDDDYLL